MSTAPGPIEMFFSYSHSDEELRDELQNHLAPLLREKVITGWHDRKISAGTEWKDQIDEYLNSARVILLLVSASFLASDYCYDREMTRAIERHQRQEARVIPVILRDCDWKNTPFARLQALPRNAKPVTSWDNRDEAFADVARGIRRAAEELASTQPLPVQGSAPAPAPRSTGTLYSVGPNPKKTSPMSDTFDLKSVIDLESQVFTGRVFIDGVPAPSGTRVTAWGRRVRDQYSVAASQPELLAEGLPTTGGAMGMGLPGQYLLTVERPPAGFSTALTFRIGELDAKETADWGREVHTELDLTAD